MTVRKRGAKWYYDFDRHRHRGVIPLARTKAEAEQAEVKIKSEVFAGTYGASQIGCGSFSEFVTDTYLPWAKDNKRSWRTDEYMAQLLAVKFRGKSFNDIAPIQVEELKREQLNSITRRGTQRSRASVNSVLSVGSSIFSLAIDLDKAVKNPFRKVKLFKLRNQQYRYLLDEEEPLLLNVINSPSPRVVLRSGRTLNRTPGELRRLKKDRSHLSTMIPVAIGVGLRKGEQLSLQVKHCDFQRRLVIATDTKNNSTREVPMNDDVFSILAELCRGRHRDEFVWEHPRSSRADRGPRQSRPYADIKNSFATACREAGIEGLQWKHLRATFGTRLGSAGYSAFEIAALMGHSDVRMTMRYVRATDGRKRQAVQATMLRKVGVA